MQFTTAPVDLKKVSRVSPLGGLNPPGHVFPTFHCGFQLNVQANVEVFAPCDGLLWRVAANGSNTDWEVHVTTGPLDSGGYPTGPSYYFGHLVTINIPVVEPHEQKGSSPFKPGPKPQNLTVRAGQKIGEARLRFDLGTWDPKVRHFIRPDLYYPHHAGATFPLEYFTDPTQFEMYWLSDMPHHLVNDFGATWWANNQMPSPARKAAAAAARARLDGRVDFDIPGALQGNWFALPISNPGDHARTASFSYEVADPRRVRFTTGDPNMLPPMPGSQHQYEAELLPAGTAFIRPEAVKASAGPVRYLIRAWDPQIAPNRPTFDLGFLEAKVLPDEKIELRIFDSHRAPYGSAQQTLIYGRK